MKKKMILLGSAILMVLLVCLSVLFSNMHKRTSNLTAKELLSLDYYDWQEYSQNCTFYYLGKEYHIQPASEYFLKDERNSLIIKEANCNANWRIEGTYCDLGSSMDKPNYYLLCSDNDPQTILLVPHQESHTILGDYSRPLAYVLKTDYVETTDVSTS